MRASARGVCAFSEIEIKAPGLRDREGEGSPFCHFKNLKIVATVPIAYYRILKWVRL